MPHIWSGVWGIFPNTKICLSYRDNNILLLLYMSHWKFSKCFIIFWYSFGEKNGRHLGRWHLKTQNLLSFHHHFIIISFTMKAGTLRRHTRGWRQVPTGCPPSFSKKYRKIVVFLLKKSTQPRKNWSFAWKIENRPMLEGFEKKIPTPKFTKFLNP